MKSSKWLNITMMTFALVLVIVSIIYSDSMAKQIGGLCIGIGSGLFGVGISNLVMIRYFNKNPKFKEQNVIEMEDERNIMIRSKAMAKAGKIVHYLILVLVFVTILIKAPLWVTLLGLGVFLMQDVLYFYFIHKLSKEI